MIPAVASTFRLLFTLIFRFLFFAVFCITNPLYTKYGITLVATIATIIIMIVTAMILLTFLS